jgi:hypothetical protein
MYRPLRALESLSAEGCPGGAQEAQTDHQAQSGVPRSVPDAKELTNDEIEEAISTRPRGSALHGP